MVDREVLASKIGYIERNIERLESLGKIDEESFLDNDYLIGASKYYLQTCIEAMLDIAHHIIARKRYRPPKNYADSFRVLGEQGVLPEDRLAVFYQMARFRNRVVHLYYEVDNKEVYKILKTGIGDFKIFIKAVLKSFVQGSGV